MTKTIFIFGLLLLFISCNSSPEACQSSPDADPESLANEENVPAPAACPEPEAPVENPPIEVEPGEPDEGVPFEASLFQANVNLTDFDSADEAKLMKAIAIIKKVIRLAKFKEQVINFTYNGERAFVDNEGFTNEEIYQKLLDGSEELRPEVDHEMDLDLELYYSSSSTVGYTYPSGLRIWMNTKFFDDYTPSQVARNVFHEWTHKLGFSHSSSYSVRRKSSVPYALGSLMEELGKQYE